MRSFFENLRICGSCFQPFSWTAVLLAAVLVSACGTPQKPDPKAGGGGLVGQWVSVDNVFTAQFRDGTFSSTANDTGATLSTGTYIVLSANEVELNWFGNLTKQENSAVCQRPDAITLNCTDSGGRSFVLRKLSGEV